MQGKDIIKMRIKELKRLKVVHETLDRHITQKTAALILELSERQVRRIVRRIRQEGERGIVHRARGSPSKHKIPVEIKDRVISLYEEKYEDFGPTFATEKLFELDKIKISKETLRKWLIEKGLWKRHRKSRQHRQRRLRCECYGQMIQVDGSHHDWLEGRGPKLVLMSYIDDANSKLFARFYDYEGTIPAMDSFKRYIKRYGIPQSIYVDKHTTYKSTKKRTIEDELANREAQSQFERALEELGVNIIHANSPEAKGRVERFFRTLQDRLIKEMRLRDISTKDEANKFLPSYLLGHNRRFTVEPRSNADVHHSIPEGIDLDKILCIMTKRALLNDLTIRHNNRFYQIIKMPRGTRAKYVCVEERINGKMFIHYKGFYLKYKPIQSRPKKQRSSSQQKHSFIGKRSIPSKDHPWRRPILPNAYSKNYNKQKTEVTK